MTGILHPGSYTINDDILIPKGKSLMILGREPGTDLKFKDYYTIKVEGTLVLYGVPKKPIIFTSAQDPLYQKSKKPNTFDWNAIVVKNTGKIEARYLEMRNCENCLIIDNSSTVVLDNITIKNSSIQEYEIQGISYFLKDNKLTPKISETIAIKKPVKKSSLASNLNKYSNTKEMEVSPPANDKNINAKDILWWTLGTTTAVTLGVLTWLFWPTTEVQPKNTIITNNISLQKGLIE